MPQFDVISKRSLENIDRKVYTPKESLLKARTLFSSHSVPAGTQSYTYRTLTKRGAAKVIANRGTDIPLVDGDTKEFTQKVITFALAANYSKQEVQQAALAGVNLDASQGAAINRGMAEFEDKLVFLGNKDAGIEGIANNSAAQKYDFSAPVKGGQPDAILNDLKTARQLITQLNGYDNIKPVLALPQSVYDELDVEFNEYQDKTILEKIQQRGWFSTIMVVNELATAGVKGAPMGLIFDNSSESVEILDAQAPTREQEEYSNMQWTIPYSEQCGGLIMRAPQTIVQLNKLV